MADEEVVEYTLVAAVSLEDRRLEWWQQATRQGHIFTRSYRDRDGNWQDAGYNIAEAWDFDAANTTWEVLLDKHAGPMFT